ATEIRALHEQELALLNLGLVYHGLMYHEQASSYLRQAAALSKEVADPILIVEEQCALAELCRINGDCQEALKLSDQALEVVIRTGLRAQQWQILYLQGRIYKDRAEPQRALECLQESVAILKAICLNIPDEAARKAYLNDKNVVLQLLAQVKTQA